MIIFLCSLFAFSFSNFDCLHFCFKSAFCSFVNTFQLNCVSDGDVLFMCVIEILVTRDFSIFTLNQGDKVK